MMHNWQFHPRTDRMPFDLWHCPGCNKTARGVRPADGECPGKYPYTAAQAAVVVSVFYAGGFSLPEDFWERAGGAALKLLLDSGAEAV